MRNATRFWSSTGRSTMQFYQVASRLAARQSLARALFALALIGLPSLATAEDEVKLSPEQAQSLGVRVVHPVASPTDKTLPYPAQIVIPTPQLWVVSSAGGRHGDEPFGRTRRPRQRRSAARRAWRVRASCRSNATTCMRSRRTCLPPSSSPATPSSSRARRCRSASWRRARPKPGRRASWLRSGGKCFGSAVFRTRRSRS